MHQKLDKIPMIYMGRGTEDEDDPNSPDRDTGQWYLDCEDFYCDIIRDLNGKYSIYFKDRKTGEIGWFDQSDKVKETNE